MSTLKRYGDMVKLADVFATLDALIKDTVDSNTRMGVILAYNALSFFDKDKKARGPTAQQMAILEDGGTLTLTLDESDIRVTATPRATSGIRGVDTTKI